MPYPKTRRLSKSTMIRPNLKLRNLIKIKRKTNKLVNKKPLTYETTLFNKTDNICQICFTRKQYRYLGCCSISSFWCKSCSEKMDKCPLCRAHNYYYVKPPLKVIPNNERYQGYYY